MAKTIDAHERAEIERIARDLVGREKREAHLRARVRYLERLWVDEGDRLDALEDATGVEPNEDNHNLIRAQILATREEIRALPPTPIGTDPDDLRTTMMCVALRRGHTARNAALLALPSTRAATVGRLKHIDGERTAQRLTTRGLLERLQREVQAKLREVDVWPVPDELSRATLVTLLRRGLASSVSHISEAIAAMRESESGAGDIVCVLRAVLASGPRPMSEVEAETRKRTGASKRSIERARARLGVEVIRVRGPNGRVVRTDLRLSHPATSDTSSK